MKPSIAILAFILIPASISLQAQSWNQVGNDIDGEAANDWSGWSVSMNSVGNTVAIGAYNNDGAGIDAGHVRIFQWNGNAWIKKGGDIDGEAAEDHAGFSVSMSSDGNTLAIGAPYNDDGGNGSGHVRIYQWNGNVWMKKGTDIAGETAGDWSGWSVSLSSDGNTVAIGTPYNDGSGFDAGQVRIYQWNGNVWVQKGSDIDGEVSSDLSGYAVSLSSDGNTVAIGARENDGGGFNAGHVRIYQWSGGIWVQKGSDIDGEAVLDNSGISVSLSADGNTVAIGAYWNDGGGTDAGHVRIYQWNNNAWIQKGSDIDGEATDDWSGYSVSLGSDGNSVAIGARFNDGAGSSAGHVRIYQWNGSGWLQKGNDIEGESPGGQSGYSVSMNSAGTTVATSAIFNDGTGTDAGHVRVFFSAASQICMAANNLTVSPITPTSARLNWSHSNVYHHYSIRGRRVGANNWLTITIPNGSSPYKDVFGLSNGVSYEWQIMTHCDAAETNSSSWSTLNTFTAGCYPPELIWVDPISVNGARFNWNSTAGAAGFEIKGRRIGGGLATITVGNITSRDVFGLLAGTAYEWTIRSICNQSGTLLSSFTPMDTFVTLPYARLASTDLNKKEEENLTIYPNPFSNQVFIEYTNPQSEHYAIRILDAKGVVVFERHQITDSKTIFDRKNLSAGVYFVEVIDEGVLRRKLIVLVCITAN